MLSSATLTDSSRDKRAIQTTPYPARISSADTMKTSVIFSVLAFATAAFATPNPTKVEPPTKVTRDLATVTSVIAQVSAAIVQLDTAVNAYTGDKTELEEEAASLVSILESGTTAIAASSSLSLVDALSLSSLVDSLQDLGDQLVSDLIAKRDVVEEEAYCEEVEDQIVEIATDARALVEAIIAKAPTIAQGIAEALAQQFYATLDEGTWAFGTGNCTDA